MQLPQELDFLKSLDKYKSDEVLDIDLGNGDIFSFKLLSTDEQLKVTELTSQEAVLENQIHYILAFRKNVMAMSLVKVNGTPCPKPETLIYSEDNEPVGLFLDIIKDKFGEMEESFFNSISRRVEEFQGKLVNDSLKKLGVKLEDLKVPSNSDYESEIDRINQEDEELMELDQDGSLEGHIKSMADFAFSEDFQKQQEDIQKRQEELLKEQEEIEKLKLEQYQAQLRAQQERQQTQEVKQEPESKVISQEEYFNNKTSQGIGSVSQTGDINSPDASLYNYNHPKAAYPKSVRKV